MAVEDRVLVAGGGPVGLIAALVLAKAGVPVTVFEQQAELRDDPRAATTHPATLELLDGLGLLDEVRRQGLVAPIFQFWDRVSGEKIAEFDHALLAGETAHPYVVQCEQFKTAQIVKDRLLAEPLAELRLGTEVLGVEQDAAGVRVHVAQNGVQATHSGRYLIGADGGRSTIRKAAEIAFSGYTWPERFVVLTTPFDFEAECGYSYRSYFADPAEWCNCFKVRGLDGNGLWRTVFPAEPELAEEDIIGDDAAQARLQRFFPRQGDYQIVHRNLYTVHQRVAETFRRGRILLAGDAAHVNNPIGGMGLNGGIQDAVSLGEKLVAVMTGVGEDHLLDLYDAQRRTIATEFVQEQSIANKQRLEAPDAQTRARNFAALRATAADPVQALGFLLRSSMIASQRRAASIGLPA